MRQLITILCYRKQGKCIFASGSPFPPVTYMGKEYRPGQGNNSYIFPGVALGVICAGAATIPEEIFLVSAERLADMVTDSDLEIGSLYPPLNTIRSCSVKIAVEVMKYVYESGMFVVFYCNCFYSFSVGFELIFIGINFRFSQRSPRTSR